MNYILVGMIQGQHHQHVVLDVPRKEKNPPHVHEPVLSHAQAQRRIRQELKRTNCRALR